MTYFPNPTKPLNKNSSIENGIQNSSISNEQKALQNNNQETNQNNFWAARTVRHITHPMRYGVINPLAIIQCRTIAELEQFFPLVKDKE